MTAFTSGGATSGAVLVKDLYESDIISAVYLNGAMGLKLPSGRAIFPSFKHDGGNNYRWVMRSAANDSIEIFTEGQAQSAPSSSQYSSLAVGWLYSRSMIQLSGHAIDAMASRHAGIDAVDQEIAASAGDIGDLLCTSFLGGTYGLEVAVDATSTYAGQARGSAGWFEAYEDDVSGALSVTDLVNMREALMDNERGSNPMCVLGPHNQMTNLFNLAATNTTVMNSNPGDKASGLNTQTFAGLPCFGVGDLTDTTILMLDLGPAKTPFIKLPVIRPVQIKAMAPSGDSDIYQISSGAALVCTNPIKQGKMVLVTA